MKIKSDIHIDKLIEQTRENLNVIERFKDLSNSQLNYKKHTQTWSVLECIEHLNMYGDYYLPQLEKSISNSKFKKDEFFKTGVFGNYFTKLMEPKSGKKKMKTHKDKNPIGNHLSKQVIEEFISQQNETLKLLEWARSVSLNKNKTSISISKLIKLKLGDTFNFVIAHNKRHLEQANNIFLKKMPQSK